MLLNWAPGHLEFRPFSFVAGVWPFQSSGGVFENGTSLASTASMLPITATHKRPEQSHCCKMAQILHGPKLGLEAAATGKIWKLEPLGICHLPETRLQLLLSQVARTLPLLPNGPNSEQPGVWLGSSGNSGMCENREASDHCCSALYPPARFPD